MLSPDTITPDLGLVILLVIMVILVALRRRDRRPWGHRTTDPACLHFREPRGWRSRHRFERGRGKACPVCFPDPAMQNDLSRLDILDGLGTRIGGPCLSHNVTCTYPEPHEHGYACDRSCVCWRSAPSLIYVPMKEWVGWTEADKIAFREAWAQRWAQRRDIQ